MRHTDTQRRNFAYSLQYPHFPTVDVGSKKKSVLIPGELLLANEGQTRQRSMTGEISGEIIKHAAMLPNDRAHSFVRLAG